MRHLIPKWIDAFLTAVGDETQRSGVGFLGETKTSDFLLLYFPYFWRRVSKVNDFILLDRKCLIASMVGHTPSLQNHKRFCLTRGD